MLRTLVRHADEEGFKLEAPGIFVRDLGIGDLTGGELTAQVVRIEPEGAYVEKMHRHDEGFSLAYVLNGWLDVNFEELGLQRLGRGCVVPAFNGPMHREVASGDGFELLLFVTRKSMSADERQRIIVQQERDAVYKAGPGDGLLYRDFKLARFTGGRFVAHAIKRIPEGQPGRRREIRDSNLRIIYVADGWLQSEFEGLGTVRMRKGSIACQPPAILRSDIAYGDGLTMVEAITGGNPA